MSSYEYISNLTFSHYPEEVQQHMNENSKRYREAAARHYLCRLFLQLISARETESFVILSEEDVKILQGVEVWMALGKSPVAFSIPDLRGKLIEPESFASALLNFSPPDIQSVAAVRSDRGVRRYAEKISSLVEKEPSDDRERQMLSAMVDAHQRSEAGKRAEKVFEVMSWIVKPLHYVPGLDAALSTDSLRNPQSVQRRLAENRAPLNRDTGMRANRKSAHWLPSEKTDQQEIPKSYPVSRLISFRSFPYQSATEYSRWAPRRMRWIDPNVSELRTVIIAMIPMRW
jgi:hypothetical protein